MARLDFLPINISVLGEVLPFSAGGPATAIFTSAGGIFVNR